MPFLDFSSVPMMEHVVSCINMTLDVAVLAVSGRRQGFESLLQLVDNTCADSFDLFFAPLSPNDLRNPSSH